MTHLGRSGPRSLLWVMQSNGGCLELSSLLIGLTAGAPLAALSISVVFPKWPLQGSLLTLGPKAWLQTSNRDPGGISRTLSSFRSHTTPLLHNLIFNFFFFTMYLFTFWLHWVFIALHGLSLVVASRGASRCYGAQAVGVWASIVSAWGLWSTHSVVVSGRSCSRHVGSSQTWDQILVLCIGRRILNHWTARQVTPGSFM